MRLFAFIVSLALVSTAMAEDQDSDKSVARELDKSSTKLQSAEKPDDSTTTTEAAASELHSENVVHRDVATRAQDYNSSRSNTTTAKLDPDDDGDSISTDDACDDAVDQDCTGNDDDLVLRKKPGRK